MKPLWEPTLLTLTLTWPALLTLTLTWPALLTLTPHTPWYTHLRSTPRGIPTLGAHPEVHPTV